MTSTQSALIVAVPEAEAAVREFRSRYDPAARWGVPAHVTVLYPFLAPDRFDDDLFAALAAVVGSVPRFDVAFPHVEWFGDEVVWLAPRPDDGFRRLTAAVWQRFPEAPPYGGMYADSVPHLTVGQDAALPELRAAGDAVAAHLPIRAAVDAVRLIAGAPGPDAWRTIREFPLGPA